MKDNLDMPNRMKVHHPELYRPFPLGDEHRCLYRIAVRLASDGCNNTYVLRHVCRLIAEVRAPGLISGKDLEDMTWRAVRNAQKRLLQGPSTGHNQKMRVNIKTELYPSEDQLREARKGKPIVSERVVEVSYRRGKR